MPTQFTITSITWERVNLTIDLSATWAPDWDLSDRQPVLPAAPIRRLADLPTPAVAPARPVSGPGLAPISEHDADDSDPDLEAEEGGDADEESVEGARRTAAFDQDEESVDSGVLPTLGCVFIRDVSQGHDVDWVHLAEGHYRIHISLSTFANRKFLPNGTWKFYAWLDNGTEAGAVVGARWPLDKLDALEDHSRVFLYAGNKSAYTVSFGITESESPLFAMRAYSFGRGGGAKKKPSPVLHPVKRTRAIIKSWTSTAKKRQLAKDIYERSLQAERIKRAVTDKPGTVRRPRILFASEAREGIEGNLLAVRDRMLERGLDRTYDFHYSFRTRHSATSLGFVKLLQEMGKADIILLDDYFPPLGWLNLSPATKVIQLWHAGSGFKSVGYSRFGKFGSPGLTNAHRKYTYTITGSRHLKHVYSEAFGIEEEAVIPTGLPRIDTFLDPADQAAARQDAYEAFPQLKGKKVIMFAPTFRGRGAAEATYPYDKIDFEALYELCGEDTVVAFRMHHFIPGQVPIPEHMRDRFIDVASYRNGNNLLLVTDLLITDYSSIIYEYSLLKRPMLFFAYDEQVYSSVRGFHRPYEETAPGKVCHTFDELLTAIRDEDFETWRGDQFRKENFDNIDTHSSDRVIDWLILGEPPAEAVTPEHHADVAAPQATDNEEKELR
ncbi:CDP-glycerol glycerophosphotransferase family protein [Tessaracoccus lacteus]|uniref:CDP-glycerol glycerophosphotransferase family protein n=1 Tax=Tessaracoccus lacteus TaxID=3041766 RepID=A0ABY8PX86_9ACTN|nr:CDP-glycerol glycerophosphotransferase family protein [Tessaracoccus sp. T21]WGT46991.1 CDP-glycerol glycerophosphotransferase family protein [Tessaracoccus sp. T21]